MNPQTPRAFQECLTELPHGAESSLAAETPRGSGRHARHLFLLLILATGAGLIGRVVASQPNGSPGGRDEIKYLLLAQRIAGIHPSPMPWTPQYPPGWPALAAVNFAVGGDVATAHIINVASLAAALVVLAFLLRTNLSWLTALAIVLAFAAHRTTINLWDSLLSEPTFFLALSSLFLVGHTVTRRPLQWRSTLLLAVLATICRSIRTAGIVCIAGHVLYLLVRPRTGLRERLAHAALACLPFAIFELALWTTYPHASILPGSGYVNQLRMAARDADLSVASDAGIAPMGIRLWSHLDQHFRDAASAMIPLAPAWWHPAIAFKLAGVTVLVLSLVGLIDRAVRGRDLISCTIVVYLLLVLCWPSHDIRFYWPVVPFLWWFAVQWLRDSIQTRLSPILQPALQVMPFLLPVAAIACVIPTLWALPLGRDYKERENEEFRQSLAWIAERAGTVTPRVASISYFQIHYYRPTWYVFPLGYREVDATVLDDLKRSHVEWIVDQRTKSKYFEAIIHHGAANIVWETPHLIVLRLPWDDTSSSLTSASR